MKKICRVGIPTIVIAFLSIFIMVHLNVTSYALEEKEVIKVGYVLNCGTIQAPVVNGSEGYLYEYLNELVAYFEGDYELEFVQCEMSEVESLLDSGEIDIYGPIGYTESLDEEYVYTESDVGSAVVYLSALSDYSVFFDDYSKLEGETIAVRAGATVTYLLYDFIEEYNIDCEVIEVETNSFVEDMNNGLYTYCLSLSMDTNTDLKSVAYLGTVDTYFIAAEENAELIEQIDNASTALASDNYLCMEQLYLKYFEDNINENIYISENEYELLQSKATYYVGYSSEYYPLSYVNSDGELVGVAIELLNTIAEEAHINIQYLDVEDTNTNLDLIDISVASSSYYDEECIESEDYLYLTFILIEDKDADSDISYIGVLDYYGMDEGSIASYKYGSARKEYSDIEEMMQDFSDGVIQGVILTSIGLNLMSDDMESVDYTMTPLEVELGVTLIYSDSLSEVRMEVFDKLITKVDSSDLEVSLSEHLQYQEPKTLGEVMLENKVSIMGFLMVLMVIAGLLDSNQRKKRKDLVELDELTGVYTSYKFNEEAKKLLKNNPRTNYSIFSVDIDNFKYINELYGYDVGTQILKTFSGFVGGKIFPTYPMGRRFADNFIMMLYTETLKDKLKDSIESENKIYKMLQDTLGEKYNFSFSVGIYDVVDRTLDFNYMVDCANLARLEGKDKTGNTVNKFTEEMDKVRNYNKEIITNMNTALNNKEFTMFYQCKNDLKTGEIIGAEALVRWISSENMRSPADFIPLFEKNGFIEKLDFYVLDTVCEFIQKNSDKDIPKISVNFSGVTIKKKRVVEKIQEVIERYDINPDKLDIEITETAFVDCSSQLLEIISELRSLGFTISLDDFGAGVSSFNRLKELPIDSLKIDRAFIVGTIGQEKGITILKNVIKMGIELDMEIVAEGIETEEQLELLQKLGCHVGQGYYFSKPCPEEEFIENFS